MSLLKDLQAYEILYPQESETISRMKVFFDAHSEDSFKRELKLGHFTGSAWVLNKTHDQVLLTHHRKLNRWLQLGGHADGDSNLLNVAHREAVEESGISEIKILSNQIFDLDIHSIPARKDEPEHLHLDVRYLFEAEHQNYKASEESLNLAWISFDELEKFPVDDSVRRLREKWGEFLRNFSARRDQDSSKADREVDI